MKVTGSKLNISRQEWEKIGKKAGWMEVDAKKKGKSVNPWAVCTKSVGREDKEKYEDCVLSVKEKHPIKKD